MGFDLRRHRRLGRLESIGAPAWLLGPVVVVAFALLATGWLALRDVPATVGWLDVGSPGDNAYISGAFPPEQNATESYRWTTSAAIVTVPAPAGARFRLEIAIASTGDEPRDLRITCPGGEATARLGPGLTPPTVPIACDSDGEIPVSISVPAVRVVGDGRPLGVAVRDVRVTALDRQLVAVWRLWAGLAAAAAITGVWLAVSAVSGKRAGTVVAVVTILAAVSVSARRPDWLLAIVAGPGAMTTLSAGCATWLLAQGRRAGPFALGCVGLASWLLYPPPDPVLLLPALWTPHDATGHELMPLLAALATVAAALLGGRRATLVAAAATLVGAGSMLAVVAARPALARWSLAIHGPDWTDIASPIGGLMLASTVVLVLLALRALNGPSVRPRFGLVIVVALALSVLVPWRDAVMNLNGDEPHYYVIAHSLATDADLELLDDYLDPDYLNATISPTGNVAVARATDADRYAAVTPATDNSRYLIPDESTGVTVSGSSGLPAFSDKPLAVVDGDGDRDMLPALSPASSLMIPIAGPCGIDALILHSADAGAATATVRLLDATGSQRWQETVELGSTSVVVHPPLDPTICDEDFAGALVIDSDSDLYAQAVDSEFGLRVHPARSVATNWLLGPLPRDQYATQDATARLALYNPAHDAAAVTIRLLTASESVLRATEVTIVPGATAAIELDLQDASAVSISSSAPIVAGAIGWLPGGSYPLPDMPEAMSWRIDVPATADRDAGVWLALANQSAEQRVVTVDGAGLSQPVSICGFCAEMLHIPSLRRQLSVSFAAQDGPIAVAAVVYEERTGALHFDLGLPILAALPIRLAGPDAAPLVSALATILLAFGLFALLRRIGTPDLQAAWGAAAVALLAPLSPFAVRLYTEPLAACIVVWALVCWDRARSRPAFALVALLLGGALPLVHGRYTPLAFAMGVLIALTVVRRAGVSRRQLVALAAVVVALVAVVAVSPFAIALRDRASAGYFSTEWVPRNLLGILLDRGSGLLPFAPWCLLALAAPRRLHPLQRAAIALIVVQLSVVALRAGGWQTFGAPSRYILPVVPLIALLAVPGAVRLWGGVSRAIVIVALAWSAGMTFLLHWLPLSGYVADGEYFIDVARRHMPPVAVIDLFPTVAPEAGSNLLGAALLLAIWLGAWIGIKYRKV